MGARRNFSAEFKAKVVLEILREEETISQIAAKHKIHPNLLQKWKKTAANGLPGLFSDPRKKSAEELEKGSTINDLYRQVGLLSMQLEWIKKMRCRLFLPVHERRALADREKKEIPLSWQAWLFGLNRIGLYYVPAPLSEEELLLRMRIDEIHTDQPCYGSRRMQAVLSRGGLPVSRKRAQRLMRDMGGSGRLPRFPGGRGELEHLPSSPQGAGMEPLLELESLF